MNQWDKYSKLYNKGIGDSGDKLHKKIIYQRLDLIEDLRNIASEFSRILGISWIKA